jgi:hypothetical protein
MKRFLIFAFVMLAISCQSPTFVYDEGSDSWSKQAEDTATIIIEIK